MDVMDDSFNLDGIRINDLCRTCLSYNDKMLSVFHNCENEKLLIYQMLMKFCSIQIARDDGFPDHMCLHCVEDAKNAFLFKKKCEKAEDTLKKYSCKKANGPDLELHTDPVKEEDSLSGCSDYDSTIDFRMKFEESEKNISNNAISKNINFPVISTFNELDIIEDLKQEEFEEIPNLSDIKKDVSFDIESFGNDMRAFSKSIKRLKKKKESKHKKGKISVQSHINSRTRSKESQLRCCDHCDFKTKLPSQLRIHMHIHTGEKPLACDLCNFRCIQSSSLQSHKLTHTNEKPFDCSYCDYKCTNSSNLKRHERRHTNDKPFVCDLCSYRCTQSSHLKEHRRIHTGEKPFLCDQCHYTCGSISNLKTHKINKHSVEKKFSCEECNFKSKTKSTLDAHKKRHTGDKKYSCNVCPYRSIQFAALESHKRMVHTKERPFACTMCPYRCVSSNYLKSHLRTHSSVKMYKCDMCSYTCHTNFKLKNHKMTHSGEKPFNCNVCDFKCAQSYSLRRHHKRNHSVVVK